MKPSDIQTLIAETIQALRPQYAPVIQQKIEAFDLDPRSYFFLAVAHDYLPESVSAAEFYERTPYTNPKSFEEGLAALAERGLLTASVEGRYAMTREAKNFVEETGDAMGAKLVEVIPLPASELHHMADLLLRVIEAALLVPEPARKPHLTVNRASDRGVDCAPLHRMLQYAADLGSFRDDVHLSAWGAYDVSGHGFEAFTYLWREGDLAMDDLIEKLPQGRGYERGDYEAALADLVGKGWVIRKGDVHSVTAEGKALRDKIEAKTDRLFDAAWAALSADEMVKLGELLARTRDELKAMQPAEA